MGAFLFGRCARIPGPLAGMPRGVRREKAVLSLCPPHPLAPTDREGTRIGCLLIWSMCSDSRPLGWHAKGRSAGGCGASPVTVASSQRTFPGEIFFSATDYTPDYLIRAALRGQGNPRSKCVEFLRSYRAASVSFLRRNGRPGEFLTIAGTADLKIPGELFPFFAGLNSRRFHSPSKSSSDQPLPVL